MIRNFQDTSALYFEKEKEKKIFGKAIILGKNCCNTKSMTDAFE